MKLFFRFTQGVILTVLLTASTSVAAIADNLLSPGQSNDLVQTTTIEGEKKTLHGTCRNNSDVNISGDRITVTYVGHRGEVVLRGNRNNLTLDRADVLTVMGDQNVVNIQKMPPDTSDLGVNNQINIYKPAPKPSPTINATPPAPPSHSQ